MSKPWIIVGYILGVLMIVLIIYSILNAEYLNAIGLCFFFYCVWLTPNMEKIKNWFINLKKN